MSATIREVEDRRLPLVFPPWFLPAWIATIAWGWWRASFPPHAAGELPERTIQIASALAVLGKFMGFACEAAFYRAVHGMRGLRLPFGRFFLVVLSLSITDLLAHAIGLLVSDQPAAAAWLAPIAGLQLLGDSVFDRNLAARTAFGSVGLLALTRVGLTAWAQSRALTVGFKGALALTTAAWLCSRLALLWGIDLLKGMSPTGG